MILLSMSPGLSSAASLRQLVVVQTKRQPQLRLSSLTAAAQGNYPYAEDTGRTMFAVTLLAHTGAGMSASTAVIVKTFAMAATVILSSNPFGFDFDMPLWSKSRRA
jgi:hypothetical protein